MTLQEKFHQWLRTEPFSSKDRVTLREAQCEVIADEFAIGFGEFIRGFRYNEPELYFRSSVKELLEIYKQEKGL
jgi:hypothetical protein